MDNFNSYSELIFSNKVLSLVLLSLLIYATYTDVKYLKIYNKFNLFIVLVRVIFAFIPVYGLKITMSNIFSSIIAFIIFLVLAVIFMHQMGGDIKFIGAFMLFFNIEYMFIFLMISSVLNMVYTMSLIFFLKKKQISLINGKKSNNNIIMFYLINLFFLKIPEDSELVKMTENDFNKYKLPFAPFFLMSYVITYILYLV